MIAFLGVLIAAGARYDGIFYASIAAAIAYLITLKNQKVPKLSTKYSNLRIVGKVSIAILTILVIIIVLFELSPIADRLTMLQDSGANNRSVNSIGVLASNIARLPLFWAGFSGALGLGWLDTQMPYATWMVASTILWGVLFVRISKNTKRQLWIAFSIASLLALLPLTVLQLSMTLVGETIQPRYFFPLLLLLAGVMLTTKKFKRPDFSWHQSLIIVLGLSMANLLAIYTNLTRYISGISNTAESGNSWNLNAAMQTGWWWDHLPQPSPMLLVFVSTLAFAVFLANSFFNVKLTSTLKLRSNTVKL